ncbi:MAG: hypothetical protein HWQ41_18290 [Nostoc sp. NOS(2021)]|uniref:hypothetical protein n=1 Tax=Nostoc sp. NOS(2021) TaxID=2815407 RepID=UPI0025EAE8B1|nr:hypothetical protein [Nostoc sp. NOS(2021)]MBN3897149.1 hypothetical protein [Nostoc sp. NOS(2021)]
MEITTAEINSVQSQFISNLFQELQDSLFQGWQDFNTSENLKIFSGFFEFIFRAGFDESQYRRVIPNPAYDNSARLIGKPFLETARKFEIHFDEIFPGSFSESQEAQKEGFEVRTFKLKAFYRNKPLCLFLLKFPHYHEKFGFPLSPELEILELY